MLFPPFSFSLLPMDIYWFALDNVYTLNFYSIHKFSVFTPPPHLQQVNWNERRGKQAKLARNRQQTQSRQLDARQRQNLHREPSFPSMRAEYWILSQDRKEYINIIRHVFNILWWRASKCSAKLFLHVLISHFYTSVNPEWPVIEEIQFAQLTNLKVKKAPEAVDLWGEGPVFRASLWFKKGLKISINPRKLLIFYRNFSNLPY